MARREGIEDPEAFPAALERFAKDPLIVCHNDADGLSAGVIFKKVLERRGFAPAVRILGKGENAYSAEFRAELETRSFGGLILTDGGTSAKLAATGPLSVGDHPVPRGLPANSTTISGVDDRPIPTSSLLAYRCAQAAGAADGLLWLAAVGIVGDMADGDNFPEWEAAKAQGGVTALRKAVSLVNAPRRTANGDASAAFALLDQAAGPKAVLSGEHSETAASWSGRARSRRAWRARSPSCSSPRPARSTRWWPRRGAAG